MKKRYVFLYVAIFCLGVLASEVVLSQQIVDLDVVNGDLRVLGNVAYNKTGVGLATGDVNGDGVPDLLIGAPGVLPDGTRKDGRVYVIFGCTTLPSLIDLNTDHPSVEVSGSYSSGGLGSAVTTADLNMDNIQDIVMSAPFASFGSREGMGAVQVIWGTPNLPAIIDLSADSADLTILGEKAWDEFGKALTTGDINGDGIQDLIVGADRADSPGSVSTGATYVVFGGMELPKVIDLASYDQKTVIYGRDANDLSGRAVACGDLNGDGIDDVVIGAHKADTPVPTAVFDAGEVYVIFGDEYLPGVIDLDLLDADVTILGYERQGWLGLSLDAGDLNADGIDDLVMGAPRMNWDSQINVGRAFLFFGREHWSTRTIDLSTDSADVEIIGPDPHGELATVVAMGNIDGQGFSDLVMGAPDASPPGGTRAGKAFAVYNIATAGKLINLEAQPANIAVFGADSLDLLGTKLCIGDVNGDGIDDLLISAVDAEPAGEVYAIFGGKAVGIKDGKRETNIPQKVQLYQNYPNPFNLSTAIRYSLSRSYPFHITLIIYNLSGQKVRTLVSANQDAGNYQATWNAKDDWNQAVPSGIYILRLCTGDFIDIKKLVLMR